MHRRDDRSVPVTEGLYLAGHIPGAAYAELPGADHTLFVGDQRVVHDTVIEFLDRVVADGAMRAALRRADRQNAAGAGGGSPTPSEREGVPPIPPASTTNHGAP